MSAIASEVFGGLRLVFRGEQRLVRVPNGKYRLLRRNVRGEEGLFSLVIGATTLHDARSGSESRRG